MQKNENLCMSYAVVTLQQDLRSQSKASLRTSVLNLREINIWGISDIDCEGLWTLMMLVNITNAEFIESNLCFSNLFQGVKDKLEPIARLT